MPILKRSVSEIYMAQTLSEGRPVLAVIVDRLHFRTTHGEVGWQGPRGRCNRLAPLTDQRTDAATKPLFSTLPAFAIASLQMNLGDDPNGPFPAITKHVTP